MVDEEDTLRRGRDGDTPTPVAVEVPTQTRTQTRAPIRPPSRRPRGSTPPGVDVHGSGATVVEAVPPGAMIETPSAGTNVPTVVRPAPTPPPPVLPAPPRLPPGAAGAARRRAAAPTPPRTPSLPPPPPRTPTPVAPLPATATRSLTGATLRSDEQQRTRALALIGTLLAVPAAALTPLLGITGAARWIQWGAAALFVVANLVVLLTPAERAWSAARVTLVALGGVVAALGASFVFGLLSGAVLLPVLGLYVIALGHHRWIARGAFGLFAVGHAGLVVLTARGDLVDRGLLTARALPAHVQLLSEGLFLAVLLGAYVHARRSRHATVRSLRQLETTVQALGERETQLRELQQDMAHALHVGEDGRWSHQVLGSYRLGPVIGRGAVGEVYAGTHVGTGEAAAVKLLHVETAAVPGNLERFEREARVAASLPSPHVVRVLEVSGAGAPLPYLAMERLRGTDLSGYLRTWRRLPLGEVVHLVRQLAAGLELARLAGIVHRDLKPQNVFRAVDDHGAAVWKILDFGVSKLADGGGTLTQGHLVGTPHYMSPEQAAGGEIDHRSDVYALAALAYRCLTGQPPFAGVEMPALVFHVVHQTPPRAGTLVELPAAVDAVLARGLAKRPAARFGTAVELAAALSTAVGLPR